jgi:CRP/FNR family transcriptional regulator, cyclic AMP receptor protein
MESTRVKRIGLLQDFSDEDVTALLSCAGHRNFKKDEDVLEQGQRSASLFLVQDGLLHVRRRVKNREILLGRLEPGNFFGEITLFNPGPTTATVRGVSNGDLLILRRDQFDDFLSLRPHAGLQLVSRILAEMANRLRQTDERLVDTLAWGGLVKGEE